MLLEKYSVKSMFYDDLLVKSWFDEIFTQNNDTMYIAEQCVHKENWKLRKFTLSAKIS